MKNKELFTEGAALRKVLTKPRRKLPEEARRDFLIYLKEEKGIESLEDEKFKAYYLKFSANEGLKTLFDYMKVP